MTTPTAAKVPATAPVLDQKWSVSAAAAAETGDAEEPLAAAGELVASEAAAAALVVANVWPDLYS